MKKTIFSLALGTFGLGMAEFGIMGVLTELAHDTGISIPSAGNMISFYAFGVVIGAPIVALFSGKFSLKTTLLFLVAMSAVGNALFTFSTSYFWLAVGRLISGFPHGAIFGVGAIILSKIAPPGRVTVAVAGMIAGMTVANLMGVPLGTWLGHQFSWRYTFFSDCRVRCAGDPLGSALGAGHPRHVRNQIDRSVPLSEKPEPWLIFAATMFGNAGCSHGSASSSRLWSSSPVIQKG